jgi:hypothetical protein
MNHALTRLLSLGLLLLGSLHARAQLVFEPQTTNPVVAFCFDPVTGQVINNCDVTLQSSVYFTPQQHNHSNPPPPSSALVPNSGNTGTMGLPVNIVTTVVGQLETAFVCASFCTFNDYAVIYNDLFQVAPSGNYVFVGATPEHPNNHFGTSPAISAIQVTALLYRQEFPANPVIALNDMALPLGGKFDLNFTWTTGSHANHSRGFAVDVRGNGGPNSIPQDPVVQNRFLELCRQTGATLAIRESVGTVNEHFHCQW